jgi:hypothetical protein
MRLAIITRYFFPDVISGRETVIYNLWRKAQDRYDVTLIAGWRTDPTLLPKEAFKVKQAFGSRMLNYLVLYLQSAGILRKTRPDVVLSNAIEVAPSRFPTAVIAYDFNFGQADAIRDIIATCEQVGLPIISRHVCPSRRHYKGP